MIAKMFSKGCTSHRRNGAVALSCLPIPVPIPGLYQALLTDRREQAARVLRLTPAERQTLLAALFPDREPDRSPDLPRLALLPRPAA
jgi:hypothetical protein